MAEFCLIKYTVSTYQIDGSDLDRDPDKLPVNGRIVFEPLMDKGDSVVVTENGVSETISLTPIEARVTNSELYHRGEPGIKLFAGGATSNPERIRYRANFHNMVSGTKSITMKPIIFEAVPGGELILSLAQPVPRQPYPGIGADQAVVNSANEAADRAWEAVATIGTVDQIKSWVSEASKSADTASTAASDALVIKNSIPATVQSEVDTRVPPKVAEVIGGDTVVRDAAAAAVGAASDDIRWVRSELDTSSDINALDDGLHKIPTGAVATALGLPEDTQGTLTQITLDRSGLYKRQYYLADPVDGPAVEYRRTYYNGTWRDFAEHGGGGSAVSSWIRGPVQDDRPVDQMMSLDDQGFWTMTSAQAAEQGMPRTVSYFVEVWSSGLSVMQEATAMLTPPVRYMRRGYNGNWSMDWYNTTTGGDTGGGGWSHGPLTSSSDLDGLDDGVHPVPSASVATALGLPQAAIGTVTVYTMDPSGLYKRMYFRADPAQGAPTDYRRVYYNGTWGAFTRLGGDLADIESRVAALENVPQSVGSGAVDDLAETVWSPTDYKADHYARIEEMRGRIGPVTTGGTAAFALVFDHGTTAVKDWAWDACRSRGIPVTMALCPGAHFGPGADSNHQATVEDVQGWVNEGMVLASHSWDHDGATGYTDIHREIVESKRVLEEMFGVPVDSWVQPGYALSTGNYDGFGTGQYASNYTDTMAGQLLQRTYPVITGYVGDDYVYPLSPNPVVGIQRSLIERIGSVDTSTAYVQEAIDTGGKHIVFIHPYALAKDISSTYHTRAEFEGFLDWIVAQRDAGDLQPMTLPELSIAAVDTTIVPDSQTYEPGTGDALALSVDTTVGTRIMAGDHMVSGDTGWRLMPLTNGWSGPVWLRRMGNEVFIRGEANAAAATSSGVLDLPRGFRAGTMSAHGVFSYGGTVVPSQDASPAYKRSSLYFNRFSVQGYSTAHKYVVDSSWPTTDDWPASLPGTPA